jgi:hypothetical protein
MSFPQYAVSKWIGHSITVSGRHYANAVPDELFDRAAGARGPQVAPGRALASVVRRDASGEILAGSCVEGAVGAAEEVRVEQRGTPNDVPVLSEPERAKRA